MTAQKFLNIQDTQVPSLGFGTYTLLGNDCYDGVRSALDIGFRHIDTAQVYDNEKETGEAINQSGIKREDIFLTTKISFKEALAKQVKSSTDESLRKLNMDYVDLILLHWPNKDVPLEITLEAMHKLKEEGKTRQIGVSNFPAGMLKQALDIVPLFAVQVEYHPFLNQDRLLEVVRANNMMLTAYSPIAQGQAIKNETLIELGKKYGKSAAQIALRWLMQQPNVSAIPRASTLEHREQNFDIWNFELTEDDMKRIFGLQNGTRVVNPKVAPDWNA